MDKHWITDENARFVLAILVWITLNWMGFTLFFNEPPSTMRDLLIALVGSLTTVFVQQIQFYNKTGVAIDRQKDDTINKLTTTAASIQAKAAPQVDAIPVAPGEVKTVIGTEQEPKI